MNGPEHIWQDDAACTSTWDELPWTSNPHDRVDVDGPVFWSDDEVRMASVCADCPVRQECRELAEHVNARGGFWAGQWRAGKTYRGVWVDTPPEALARLQELALTIRPEWSPDRARDAQGRFTREVAA